MMVKIGNYDFDYEPNCWFFENFRGPFKVTLLTIVNDIYYQTKNLNFKLNQYRRKRPKVDASIFDSVLSHTRRSDVSEKREENSASTFGRFRLWTSFESSPVTVENNGQSPWDCL